MAERPPEGKIVGAGEDDPYDPETDKRAQSHAEVKRQTDMAYARTVLEARKSAYMRVFEAGAPSSEDRELVKADLKWFCFAGVSAFHEDERIHCLQSGRQEAYLRIEDYTRLTVDALVDKYVSQQQKE